MIPFNGTPVSIVETKVIHSTHRAATSLLFEAAEKPSVPASAVAALRDFLVANLNHHHRSEDHQLWPMILKEAPQASAAFSELSAEHEQLDAALDALEKVEISEGVSRKAYADRALAVRDLVHAHMDHEEPLLLPALREYISDEAWHEFAAEVKETNPLTGIHFLIGFVDKVGSKEEVEFMLGDLPAPVLEAMRKQAEAAFVELGATP